MKILAIILLLACTVQEAEQPIHNESEFVNDFNEAILDGFGEDAELFLE